MSGDPLRERLEALIAKWSSAAWRRTGLLYAGLYVDDLEAALRAGPAGGSMVGNHSIRDAGPIMIACMDPTARELLDGAMTLWRAHRAGLSRKPDDEVYAFAYWLFRWSGLIAPPAARTAAPEEK